MRAASAQSSSREGDFSFVSDESVRAQLEDGFQADKSSLEAFASSLKDMSMHSNNSLNYLWMVMKYKDWKGILQLHQEKKLFSIYMDYPPEDLEKSKQLLDFF